MTDIITVRGYVATEVRVTLAQSGLPITGFRMCSTERRFDREANAWVDGHTNWYSVSMFRQLATNAGVSIKKGDRVIVTGRLKVRPWINADGRTGTSVEIDADTAGHDLMWGTANFRRTATDRAEAPSVAHADDQLVDPATQDSGPDGLPGGVDPATGEIDGSIVDADEGAIGDAEGGTGPSSEGHEAARRQDLVDTASVPF
ncbi:single-strand DNA-binding protein [Arthrobacter sp. PL16]|uniref:single-stranded DNA-binding protein n=1 Tax=Arthrobacter sp. PL16 TaxID=3071720 RepID=UPI002DF8E0A6|nr:single-strand DNA-binding protein [Arthrobacter sp. PL16]